MSRSDRRPVVSIVIPFLNAERFMSETIASVMAQTFSSWELFLVDDGSTDSSTDLAKEYAAQNPGRIHYLEHSGHTNCGTAASRNRGIAESRGKYIAPLDADDVWLPQKLAQQTALLEANPSVSMVYGLSQYWHSWTGRAEDRDRDYVLDLGIPGDRVYSPRSLTPLVYPLGTATAASPSDWLIRRDAIEQVNGFEEQFIGPYQLYEDQAFLAKMYLHGSIFVSTRVWDKYRIHQDSCVARVRREGQYAAMRSFFLKWLDQYLREKTVQDGSVWDALERAHRTAPVPEESSRVGKWALRCAAGSVAELIFPNEIPEGLRIDIQSVPSNVNYDVQLNMARLKVETGHDYAIRFRARADSRRRLSFGFAEAHSPWANLGLYREIGLTPEWQDFEGTFTAPVNENNGRIHFDAGESSISVELATVQFLHLHHRAPVGEPIEPWELSVSGGGSAADAAAQPGQAVVEIPRPGEVQFGSFRRLTPISNDWGWDRGLPVDRYYIHGFLARNAGHIRGRVLEVGDNSYTRQFGGRQVTTSDVLHVEKGAPGATIIGDLSDAPHIPSNTFDCIIFTQTLQYVYDVRAGVRTLHRILKPGGVLLATVPGITPNHDREWSSSWYWSFTQVSMQRLLDDEFSKGQATVEAFGNVLASTSFLQGLSVEELTRAELNYKDSGFVVIIAGKAVKRDEFASHT